MFAKLYPRYWMLMNVNSFLDFCKCLYRQHHHHRQKSDCSRGSAGSGPTLGWDAIVFPLYHYRVSVSSWNRRIAFSDAIVCISTRNSMRCGPKGRAMFQVKHVLFRWDSNANRNHDSCVNRHQKISCGSGHVARESDTTENNRWKVSGYVEKNLCVRVSYPLCSLRHQISRLA